MSKAINICFGVYWNWISKQRNQNEFRHFFQVLWAVITNSYLIGFVRGKIYQGKIKNICVPGMNCYSCPGAVAACPIGALQATIGSYEYKFAFYVAGFMILVGTFMGRFVCGWLCPIWFDSGSAKQNPASFQVKRSVHLRVTVSCAG